MTMKMALKGEVSARTIAVATVATTTVATWAPMAVTVDMAHIVAMEAMDHMEATWVLRIQGTRHTMARMARTRATLLAPPLPLLPLPLLLEVTELSKGARIEAAVRRHRMPTFFLAAPLQ